MTTYKIVKVLNSSVVLVEDKPGIEYIILQKGIGYGKKSGQSVVLEDEGQVFVPMASNDGKNLAELMAEVSPEYAEVVQQIAADAEKKLDVKLNHHIYVALIDHLHFAVERMNKGMMITNSIVWEVQNFYPKEYKIGQDALEIFKEKMGIELPESEAANIAFHIINAEQDDIVEYDAMRSVKLIGTIDRMIMLTMNISPDKESVHYGRYLSHIQFFARRFFTDKMLDSDDDTLFEHICEAYPKAVQCAEKIRTYLIKEYDVMIPNEEVMYLAIHIQRLAAKTDQ